MSKRIFKDPAHQEAFETEGFVQLQLLQAGDISELLALFDHYFPEPAEGFFSSSYLNDFDLKKEISGKVAAIIDRRLRTHFVDYRLFGSAFLSKTAGNRSEMPMHQDWTIVDEEKYVAVNVWTPLQDANKENGSLEVLKGSHAFAPVRRSPTIPFFWAGYEGEMQKSLTALEVKAGEAVVLNQALVHYSPANQTDSVRVAITTGLLSAAASMEFYYQSEPGTLEVIDMEDDFLLRFEDFHEAIFKRPVFGKQRETVAYQHPDIPREQIMTYLKGLRPAEPAEEPAAAAGFWSRIKGLFS